MPINILPNDLHVHKHHTYYASLGRELYCGNNGTQPHWVHKEPAKRLQAMMKQEYSLQTLTELSSKYRTGCGGVMP